MNLGRLRIIIGWAPKSTVWFVNSAGIRTDMLFGVTRKFHRLEKTYTWSFYAGRLTIKWGLLK